MNNQNNDNKKISSYFSKFMIESPYDVLMNEGTSTRNREKEVQMMVKYFGDFFSAEELRVNNKKYNLETMFDTVRFFF